MGVLRFLKGCLVISFKTWSIYVADTISPTASVSTQENFTGAANVLVSIRFSEPCPGRGGFKCTSVRDCDVSLLILPVNVSSFIAN